MSNENQETIADIVSEMRHDCPARHMDGTMYRDVDWVYTKGTVKRLADRIEAAANHQFHDTTKMIPEEVAVSKMETTTPTCGKSSQVGNAAAMRDALAQAQRVLHCAIVADILKGEDAHEALNAVTTSLSSPIRNCDVGTAEEQYERWRSNCGHGIPECFSGCKVYKRASELGLSNRSIKRSCKFVWAQMPYEEGGEK